ncbi:MAG: hypothetical protein ACK5LJ_05415 [Paracoccus sp. (in: a-proteobacteria)]
MELSSKLKDQLKRAITLSNPAGLHKLDEDRYIEFFEACADADIDVTPRLIDLNWPSATTVGLGGDPAKSDKVQDRVYELIADWKKSRTIGG